MSPQPRNTAVGIAACILAKPCRISFFARVRGRFHCRHTLQRMRRQSHVSSPSKLL